MRKFDIVLPKKYDVRADANRPDNVLMQWNIYHNAEDISIAREVICEMFPDYVKAFDEVMRSKSMYICNMFVSSKEELDRYCSFLFPLLSEIEKRINNRGYAEKRLYGYLSERLFNVYIWKHNLKVKELYEVFYDLSAEH